jgi:CheY-like chemotaxis protein/anti-sigma regulatory factor (Ser/Thr protein kinase)
VAAMSDNLSRLSDIAELQDRNEALPVETVDLFVVLRRLSSVYGGQADGKGVRLVVKEPAPGALLAASDGARLWEILANLVSNAIKFSDTGRRGWVLVRAISVGDTLRITIRDNGVGIDPRFHRRIFDEYFQVGNPQRDRDKGYGLGLSIVRETVSRLSGHRLCLRSACGQGSRFDLFIPKARSCDSRPTVPSSRPVNLAVAAGEEGFRTTVGALDGSNRLLGRYALLVEDDVATRQALTETLEGWGMLVEAVGSPDEALTAVRRAERFFDVVVSDFNLPGPTDGLGVVDAVRSEQGQPTPAIIVSGRLAAIDPGRLRKVDARTMAKPLDPVQLRSELESCVAA